MNPPSIHQMPGPFSQAYFLALSHSYLLLSLLAAVYFLRNKYGRSLSSIPGPSLAAWTSLWRLWDVSSGSAHLYAIELHRKYGSLVRIAPHVISVGDPAEIPNIYGAFTKTALYPIQSIVWQQRPAMNLFSEPDPALHQEHKKKVAKAFSLRSVLQSENKIDECTMLFMQKLESKFASKARMVDFGTWLQYWSFDVIGELTFARKFGFLERGADVDGMINSIKNTIEYAGICGQIPWLHHLLLGNPLLTLLTPAMDPWNPTLVFTLKALNSRISIKRDDEVHNTDVCNDSGNGKDNDMLSRWLHVQRTSGPSKMSTRDIVIYASMNVFAGSDTVAIALRSVFYHLLKTKGEMNKVVAEIDAADREGKLSQPVLSYEESITHLPYLGAAIKEALRLHSPVGLIMERNVPDSGAIICGKKIPRGTIVGINSWVIAHNPNLFPSPSTFDPSRWIRSPEDQLRQMEVAFQFVFCGGSRICIGRHIALVEIHKVVPQLLRAFSIELDTPGREWKVWNRWFVQQTGLICRLKKRTGK